MAFIISGKEESISFQNKSAVFIRYSPIFKCPIKNIALGLRYIAKIVIVLCHVLKTYIL